MCSAFRFRGSWFLGACTELLGSLALSYFGDGSFRTNVDGRGLKVLDSAD